MSGKRSNQKSRPFPLFRFILVAIAIVTIAALVMQNLQPLVTIYFLGQQTIPLPLSFAMLAAFICGGISAFLVNMISFWLGRGTSHNNPSPDNDPNPRVDRDRAKIYEQYQQGDRNDQNYAQNYDHNSDPDDDRDYGQDYQQDPDDEQESNRATDEDYENQPVDSDDWVDDSTNYETSNRIEDSVPKTDGRAYRDRIYDEQAPDNSDEDEWVDYGPTYIEKEERQIIDVKYIRRGNEDV